jgi:hypothetical protein
MHFSMCPLAIIKLGVLGFICSEKPITIQDMKGKVNDASLFDGTHKSDLYRGWYKGKYQCKMDVSLLPGESCATIFRCYYSDLTFASLATAPYHFATSLILIMLNLL